MIEQYMTALAACAKDNAEIVAEIEQAMAHIRHATDLLAAHVTPQPQTVPAAIRQQLIQNAHRHLATAYTAVAQELLQAGLSTMDWALAEKAQQTARQRVVVSALRSVTQVRAQTIEPKD